MSFGPVVCRSVRDPGAKAIGVAFALVTLGNRMPDSGRPPLKIAAGLRMDHDQASASDEDPASDGTLAHKSRMLREALARYFGRFVRDPSEIDDLVQDVFLRVVKRGGSDGLENLDGYMFETAASVLNDRFRRRKVRHADRHLPFDQDHHAGSDFSPERVLMGREAVRATTLALMELPQRTRDIFILRRLEGLSHGEIATRLGISVSAVEKHMLRATRRLLARVGASR